MTVNGIPIAIRYHPTCLGTRPVADSASRVSVPMDNSAIPHIMNQTLASRAK